VSESDLDALAEFGYEHRSTKRNASCGNLELVKVWRWEAEPLGPPSTQHLPEGCRRDVFYAPETVVDCRMHPFVSWKGPSPNGRRHYLVRWRGHPEADECTWEPARDLDFELRKEYDSAHQDTHPEVATSGAPSRAHPDTHPEASTSGAPSREAQTADHVRPGQAKYCPALPTSLANNDEARTKGVEADGMWGTRGRAAFHDGTALCSASGEDECAAATKSRVTVAATSSLEGASVREVDALVTRRRALIAKNVEGRLGMDDILKHHRFLEGQIEELNAEKGKLARKHQIASALMRREKVGSRKHTELSDRCYKLEEAATAFNVRAVATNKERDWFRSTKAWHEGVRQTLTEYVQCSDGEHISKKQLEEDDRLFASFNFGSSLLSPDRVDAEAP